MADKKRPIPEDVSGFTFIGKRTHETTLNHLLEFLEFLIIHSATQVSLGTQNIDKLWKIFVQQPNFTFEQNLFLKWVNQHRENQFDHKEYFLFTDEERKYFFTQILCSSTYVANISISYGQVKCFHKYFKVINRQEENLEIVKRRMRVVNFEKLVGLDTLWKIANESETEKIREESTDLLVDLHLKFDPSVSSQEQNRIWVLFIDHCMQNLHSDNDDLLVSNSI